MRAAWAPWGVCFLELCVGLGVLEPGVERSFAISALPGGSGIRPQAVPREGSYELGKGVAVDFRPYALSLLYVVPKDMMWGCRYPDTRNRLNPSRI
jgi:hypothetical protein